MNGPGRKWRACLRIARREVWRSKARSLLVATMVGVPVLVVAGAAVLLRTSATTEDQTTLRSLGAADAMVAAEGRSPIVQNFRGSSLPADGATSQGAEGSPWSAAEIAARTGGRAVPMRTGKVLLDTDKGAISARVRELDIRDPVTGGLATLRSGRAPAEPSEILVSERLAERGFAPGTSVRTAEKTLRVVGIVRDPADFSVSEIVGLGGSVLDPQTGPQTDTEDGIESRYLVDTGGKPVGWTDVQRLNQLGLAVTSRAVLSNPPPAGSLPRPFQDHQSSGDLGSMGTFYAIVVASIVLEVALLAGPAFAVGARRQRRQFALLLAAGGTPRDVRRIVLGQGLVLGLGASLTGAVLSIGLVLATRPLIEQVYGAELGPYDVRPLELGAIVALGTVAAVAAAVVPARQAARLQAIEALTGRGAVRTRLGWPTVGGLLVAGGVIAVCSSVASPNGGEYRVVFGTFAIAGGLIMALPALLGLLGKLSGRLPLALRLAARDTARHRARSAAAIAAVMGTTIGITALAIGSSSDFAENQRDYLPRERPGTMAIAVGPGSGGEATQAQLTSLTAEIQRLLPNREVLLTYGIDAPWNDSIRYPEVVDPDCRTNDCGAFSPEMNSSGTVGGGDAILAATPAEVERLTGVLTARERQTLQAGGVLVPDAGALMPDGTVRVRVRTDRAGVPGPTTKVAELPAVAASQLGIRSASGYSFTAAMVTTRPTAERLGLDVRPLRIVAPPGGPEITTAQQDTIQELVNGLGAGAEVYVERGFQETYTFVFLVLAAAGGLIVLIGTATATALSLDEARPDFATLAALGADPRTRRKQAIAYAVVIGLTGSLLGVAAGAAPGIAVTWPLTTSSAGGQILDIPWLLLGLVVVAVPLFTALCAALLTRSVLPMVRRIA